MDPSLQALHSDLARTLFKCAREVLRAGLISLGKDFKMGPILVIMRSEFGQVLAQYRTLIVLVLTLPTTVCSAERSFSGLSRIKSELRTTPSQIGMNSYAVCHLNRSFTDQLDLNAVAIEFIRSTMCHFTTHKVTEFTVWPISTLKYLNVILDNFQY